MPRGDLAAITTDATPGGASAAAERVWDAVEAFYRTGLQPAIALCVRHRGEVVLDRAIGHARGNAPGDPPHGPKVLATPHTPFCIFSASKAITAVLIHHLDDQGLLHIDDRVVEYLPEFGKHGKQTTTIRHILTHRAGIPSLGAPHNRVETLLDWDRIIELLCDARPASPPGRRLAYHAITGGFILGEIARRVTGKDLHTYLREVVLEPLGFRGMNYGWPADDLQSVAHNVFTGSPVPFPLAGLVTRALDVPWEAACQVSNDARYLTTIVPAGNIVATANEACRFYDLLLHEGALDGVRVFDPRTIRRAVNESSYLEMDFTMVLPVRYGLGLMLGADRVSPFGPRTPNAYGHLGFIQVHTWADPDRHLSAALLTSGKPFLGIGVRPLWRVLRAIGEAWGLPDNK